MNTSTLYNQALMNCKLNPAYFAKLPTGDLMACPCYPLMDADTHGWTTVRRKFRTKKIRTNAELEVEADLNTWEDIDHYGRATYAHNDTMPAFEHNGALFDIGSRF